MAGDPKFTTKQMATIVAVVASVAGAGGAGTVLAQDAVQDAKIERNAAEIAELRRQVLTVTSVVDKIEAKVEAQRDDLNEIKSDTKEALRLLNQSIGRNGRDR